MKCPITFTDILCSQFVPMDASDREAFAGVEGDGFICGEIVDTSRPGEDPAIHKDWIAVVDVSGGTAHIEVSHVETGYFATWEIAKKPDPTNCEEDEDDD